MNAGMRIATTAAIPPAAIYGEVFGIKSLVVIIIFEGVLKIGFFFVSWVRGGLYWDSRNSGSSRSVDNSLREELH